jgi:hypothetical protein
MTSQHAQLTLIDTPRSWRIDEHTREVGREGIARARAALRHGRHSGTPDPPAADSRAKGAAPPRHRRAAA